MNNDELDNEGSPLSGKVKDRLTKNPGLCSYGQLAREFNTSARAIGQVMKSLARLGNGALCALVIYQYQLNALIAAK